MARPRKPTRLHLLQGTAKKHPERMRERENEPEPNRTLGDPPECLTDSERELWAEFVGKIPNGVVGDCDEYIVECAVRALAVLRATPATDPTWLKYCQRFEIQIAKLGMTPADRSKVIGGA